MRSFYIIPLMLIVGACGVDKSESRQGYGGLTPATEPRFCGDRPERQDASMLAIPSRTQECSSRCWAAVLEMVGRYYGKNLRECDFAALERPDEGTCCASDDCGNYSCNHPVSEEQISALLMEPLGLHYQILHRALTKFELNRELSNGRPVMIGFGPQSGEHVALVIGFIVTRASGNRQTVYHLADPWPELGLVQRSYNELLAGPITDQPMPWSATWFRISPRADGCNEMFDPLCGCGR